MIERESERKVNLDEVIEEVEGSFRKSIGTISTLGERLRDVLDRQPGAVLAGVAVLGFLSGLALRRAVNSRAEPNSRTSPNSRAS